MEKILNVAEYIFKEYQRVTGEYIDEMKLQIWRMEIWTSF